MSIRLVRSLAVVALLFGLGSALTAAWQQGWTYDEARLAGTIAGTASPEVFGKAKAGVAIRDIEKRCRSHLHNCAARRFPAEPLSLRNNNRLLARRCDDQ